MSACTADHFKCVRIDLLLTYKIGVAHSYSELTTWRITASLAFTTKDEMNA